MPYISQNERTLLDPKLDAVISQIKDLTGGYPLAFAGLLNYCCTRLALGVITERKYGYIALVTGVFHNLLDEFYRRYAALYEDEKIKQNGDIY